ncbi:MAG: outer membrane beta-barrel protein [Myxococcales bacterium]|nr:outer membrane beta-barrel protein [Myxococcales bacterium]
MGRRAATVASLFAAVAVAPGAASAEPTLTWSGFVDTSLVYGFAPEIARDDGVTLGLDQAEVDLRAAVADGLSLGVDLQLRPPAWEPGDGDGPSGLNVLDEIVEQAWAEWFPGGGDAGFFLRLGKWNAPVGFEAIDPTGLYQFSQGLLFTYATPSNLTGFAAGYRAGGVESQAWLTNDWDTASTAGDAIVGGRVAYGREKGSIGLSATFGPVSDESPRVMVDVDATLRWPRFLLGAELNFGAQAGRSSIGFLVTANYQISSKVSATVRFDTLNREILDAPYKGKSLTAAVLAALASVEQGGEEVAALSLIAEVRADFQTGAETAGTGAIELLATF